MDTVLSVFDRTKIYSIIMRNEGGNYFVAITGARTDIAGRPWLLLCRNVENDQTMYINWDQIALVI